MGLSCRCCKRKCSSCVCSPCPAIKSELLDPAVDYGVIASDPPDERADKPERPLLGPSPPYPFEYKVETTCGYPKARRTTDLLEGLCEDPDNPAPECQHQYDLYECQANGPRMIRIGPHKDTTHFGINLGPKKIPCSEVSPCPQDFDCLESDEEPGKSYCEYNQSEPCDDESDPCPEGYECLSGECVRINEELTKEFLQHPIQAEFGFYPVKNEKPKATCPTYNPPMQCTDSLLCPDRFECVQSTDPEDVTIKLPADVRNNCVDGYCAEVGFGYTCVPPHPAGQKPKTFPLSVDDDGDPIACSDNVDCEGLTGLVGSQCVNGDCMTPAYCEKRAKYCEPVRVIDPEYSYVEHSGVPTFLVPMDGLPYGPLPLLGGNTREIRNDPLRRQNLATDEHVGACYSLDLNRDPKEITGARLQNECSEDSQCVDAWGLGSRCLEPDAIDPNAKSLKNQFPDQQCGESNPCPEDDDGNVYECVSGECQPVCTDKLCRQQHGAGFYCNDEGNCQTRKCFVPPGECTPGCCNEIFGDPWLPNHEWACEERGSRPPLTDTVCQPGDPGDNFCFEEHGAGYTCEFSDQVDMDGNPQTFCQGPKRPNPDVGLGCFLSPLDGYTPKNVSVDGNRDEIIPRPIGETYGLPPTPCSPDGEPCGDGYTCVTDALNAIRRVLPDGVACTNDLCEQRYGPGFKCDLQNFQIKTPKRFYKKLETRELPVSKTRAVRSIKLSGSTGTWEVDKGIYQGDSWNNAVAKAIITGGVDLDTSTPLIEYTLQGDLTDFSDGTIATKEFNIVSDSNDDAAATDVTAVMQRCPYGYAVNELGFCQAVATEADGTPIEKDYALINPITDLIEDTPTIRLSNSTGTWTVGDGIYQGDNWTDASAKGEIIGGTGLSSDSPIIEYKLYGDQDFVENEQVKQYDLASKANGAAVGTAEQVVTTGELIADTDPCSEYSPIGIDPAFVMNVPIGEYKGFEDLYEENCAYGNCTTCERMVTVDQENDLEGACNNLICNTLDLPSNDTQDGDFTVDPGTWECFGENFIRKPLPANVVCTTSECQNRYGLDFDCDPDPDHHGCINITGPIECINVLDLGGSEGRGVCTKEVGQCELECGNNTTDDCPEGFECSEGDTEITRLLVGEEECNDGLCEEQFGPGFTCNEQGFCSSSYRSCKPSLTTYFGVTTDYGGKNSTSLGEDGEPAPGRHGIGLYNLDSRKIRTRLYLDYGYYTHYPFDKGHINVELKPTGCAAFEEDKKARIWKANSHRIAYPKVNTVTIGNRFPSAHDTRFDLAEFDDFVSVGVGPYTNKDSNRWAFSAEPGGLVGLGDPPQENHDREADPPRYLNDDYNPAADPNGLIKGCDPALRPPCTRSICVEKEFEYLNHSSSSQVGVSDTNMDDWRKSNQSVFSHNNVPAGAVGGLIIDRLDVIPINYKFPAHFTSPSFWVFPPIFGVKDSPASFEQRLENIQSAVQPHGNGIWRRPPVAPEAANECAVNAVPGVSNFMIRAVDGPVEVAIYYNSVIGRHPVRYDGPELHEAVQTNQFLPPHNGWLENIWQLGDIASPRDWTRKRHIEDLHGLRVQHSRLPQSEGGVPWEDYTDGSRNVEIYTQTPCAPTAGYAHGECPGGRGTINRKAAEEGWICHGYVHKDYLGTCRKIHEPQNISPLSIKNSNLQEAFSYAAMDEKDYIEKYEDIIPFDSHWNRPQANRSQKVPDPTREVIELVGGVRCDEPIPVTDDDGEFTGIGCELGRIGVCDSVLGDPKFTDFLNEYEITDPSELICITGPTGDEMCGITARGCPEGYTCAAEYGDCGDDEKVCVPDTIDYLQTCGEPALPELDDDDPNKECVLQVKIPYGEPVPGSICGEGYELQDEANQQCVAEYGAGFTCVERTWENPTGNQSKDPAGNIIRCTDDGDCGFAGEICNDSGDGLCYEHRGAGGCKGPTITKDNCTDEICQEEFGPYFSCDNNGKCEGRKPCPVGYVCHHTDDGLGTCEPADGDDTKLSKHLLDYWMNGVPFPAFSGDHDGNQQVWFKSTLDPYGEVSLKPWLNPHERDPQRKHKELNMSDRDEDGNLVSEPKISNVLYPPTLYSGGTVGSKGMDNHERATTQWWWEEPTHYGNPWGDHNQNVPFDPPFVPPRVAGYMYGEYLAQLGIGTEWHSYDIDWMGQIRNPPASDYIDPAEFMKEHYFDAYDKVFSGDRECCVEKFGTIGPDFGFYCPLDADLMIDQPARSTHYNFRPMTNVREVHRQIDYRTGAWWDLWKENPSAAEALFAESSTSPYSNFYEIGRIRWWNWHWDDAFYFEGQGQFPKPRRSYLPTSNPYIPQTIEFHMGFLNFAGQPTGSYHGRDGMLRYNIHPWAQLYNQHRITDSLLEVGRSFAENQKLMSSFGIECGGQGIFKTVAPTVFERFGYNQTGNVLFELEQPESSQLAELVQPRFLNYRPHTAIPPGTARHIKIGGPGAAWMVYYLQAEITWMAFRCEQKKYAIVPPDVGGGSVFYGPGYTTPSPELVTQQLKQTGALTPSNPNNTSPVYQCDEGELAARTRKTGVFFGQGDDGTMYIPGVNDAGAVIESRGAKPERYLNPFISPVLRRHATFPRPGSHGPNQGDNYGLGDGRSGTVAEEQFDIRNNPTGAALINAYNHPVVFYQQWDADRSFGAYRTNWGTFELGKVYGLSKWPRGANNEKEIAFNTRTKTDRNDCEYNRWFYFGGDGYFDPDDLRSQDVDLQNLDPDKGQFVFVQILGLQDELTLPGLPNRFKFGMVGSSHAGFFHHYNSWGMMPTGGNGMRSRFYPPAEPNNWGGVHGTFPYDEDHPEGRRRCGNGNDSEGDCPPGYTCVQNNGEFDNTCMRRFLAITPNMICQDPDPSRRESQSCLRPSEWMGGHGQIFDWRDHLTPHQETILGWKDSMTNFKDHYFDVYDVPNKFSFPVSAHNPSVRYGSIITAYDSDTFDTYYDHPPGCPTKACHADIWQDYKAGKGAYNFPSEDMGEDCGGTMYSLLKTPSPILKYSVPAFIPEDPNATFTDPVTGGGRASHWGGSIDEGFIPNPAFEAIACPDIACDLLPGQTPGGLTYLDTHLGTALQAQSLFDNLQTGQPYGYKIRSFAKMLMEKYVSNREFLLKYYYAQTTRVVKAQPNLIGQAEETQDLITTNNIQHHYPDIFNLTETVDGVPPQSYVADPITITSETDLGVLHGNASDVKTAMTDTDDTTFILLDNNRGPGTTTQHSLESIKSFFNNQNPKQIRYDKETIKTVTPFCRSMRATGDWQPIQAQIKGQDGTPYTTVFTIVSGNVGEITDNTSTNVVTTQGMRAPIDKWDKAELYITGGNSAANETYSITFDGDDGVDDKNNQIISAGHEFEVGDKVQYLNNSGGNAVVGLTHENFYFVGPGTAGPASDFIHLYATLQDALDDKDGTKSSVRISIAPGGEGEHSLTRDVGNCQIYELSFAFTTDQIAKAEVALILKRGDTTGFDAGGWLVAGPLPARNDMVPNGPAHYRFARYQRFPGEECVDTYDKECALGGSRPCGKAADLNEAVTKSAVPIGDVNYSRNNGVVGRAAYGGFMPTLHYVTEDMWFRLAEWGIPVGDVGGSVDRYTEAVTDWGIYYLANQYSREGAKGDSGLIYNAYEAAKVTFLEDWNGKPILAEGGDISWAGLYDKTILQLSNVGLGSVNVSIPLLPDLPGFGYSYQGAVLGEYIPRFATEDADGNRLRPVKQNLPCDGDYDSGSDNPCLDPGTTCGVQSGNQDEIQNFGICYGPEINPYGLQLMWISTGIDEVVNPQPLVEYVKTGNEEEGTPPTQCLYDFHESEYMCGDKVFELGHDGINDYCKDIAEVITGVYDGFCGYDINDPENLLVNCWLPDPESANVACVAETGDDNAKCINGECHTAEPLGECSDELCESLYGEGFRCDVDRCIDAIPTRPNFAKEEYICARGLDFRTGLFSQDTNSCMRSSRFYGGEIADPCPLKGNEWYRMDTKIESYTIQEELMEPSEEQDDRDRLGVTPFHWPWVLGDLCVDWGSGPPRRDTGNMGMGIDERFGWHHKATEDIKGKSITRTEDVYEPGDIDENFLNRIEGGDGVLTPGDLFNILSLTEVGQETILIENEKGTTRNTLQRVAKYYGEAPRQPEDQLVNPEPLIEEPEILSRSVTYNQYPNTFEATLYRSGIISGYTNTGDMQFFSDFHRKRNDILQAQPTCDLWTDVYDFKWPMTPSTGTPPTDIAAGTLGQVELSTRALPLPEDASAEDFCTTELCVEAFGVGWFCNEDGLCQRQSKININEKPVITFRNGAKNVGTAKAQKLWFHIDNDGCNSYIEQPYLDPPVACSSDTDCGEGYECREYNETDGVFGCDSLDTSQQFCLPVKCKPQIANATQIEIEEKRKALGYDHLVLQPSSNPELDGYAMCPTAHLNVPYWGPDIRIRSAMMNRDLITKDECSICSLKTKSEIPEVKIWPDVPCFTDNQPCVDKFGAGIETACVTVDPDSGNPLNEPLCQTTDYLTCTEDAPITRPCCPPGERCLEVDVYGCRECAQTRPPTVSITSPEDQEPDGLLDPNSGPDGFAQDCTKYEIILKDDGRPNEGCGPDEECYVAVDPSRGGYPNYSNFRAQYPYITTDEIACESDYCQFLNICPPGFECNSDGDFCDPIPLGHIPRIGGVVDIQAIAAGGSGPGLDTGVGPGLGVGNSGKLVDYELLEVQFTITQVNSDIDDPNFGFPIGGTEIVLMDSDPSDGVSVGWDTTQGPNSIYQIKAASRDEAENVSVTDTIYVLVENE